MNSDRWVALRKHRSQLLLRVHYAILQYERLMAPAVDDGAESDVADDS